MLAWLKIILLKDSLLPISQITLEGLKRYVPVDTGRKLNVHKTFRRRPGQRSTKSMHI